MWFRQFPGLPSEMRLQIIKKVTPFQILSLSQRHRASYHVLFHFSSIPFQWTPRMPKEAVYFGGFTAILNTLGKQKESVSSYSIFILKFCMVRGIRASAHIIFMKYFWSSRSSEVDSFQKNLLRPCIILFQQAKCNIWIVDNSAKQWRMFYIVRRDGFVGPQRSTTPPRWSYQRSS